MFSGSCSVICIAYHKGQVATNWAEGVSRFNAYPAASPVFQIGIRLTPCATQLIKGPAMKGIAPMLTPMVLIHRLRAGGATFVTSHVVDRPSVFRETS